MFYLGIDVSKAKLDCCLLNENALDKRKSKVVANTLAGIVSLLQWLVKQGAEPGNTHALLEGTGVYHETAATALHDAGLHVSIVNPAQVKNFAQGIAVRTKTDASDSAVLARFGALTKPITWQPPPPHIRKLKALLSRHAALSKDLRREKNRMEKARASDIPERILQSLQDSIDFIKKELNALQKDIDSHIDRHPDLKADLALLQSIPAVGHKVGTTFLCLMYSLNFQRAEQLAAYLGIVPIERQSGSSLRGRARLSKTGPSQIRAVLYMAAIVGIRHNPHVKAIYERLIAKGKCKMAALGAAMRKIVHLCFGVFKNKTPYRPDFLSNS